MVRIVVTKQQGFSLIEVAITVFVIASGLLGLGLAQISSISANQEAYFRNQAINVATSLSNRFRTNENYFLDSDNQSNIYSNNQSGQYFQYCQMDENRQFKVNLLAAANCDNELCEPEQIASYDINTICTQEFQSLAMPDSEMGAICHDADPADGDNCSPGSLMSIYVTWRNKVSRADLGENELSPNLQCLNAIWSSMSDEELKGRRCVKMDFLP